MNLWQCSKSKYNRLQTHLRFTTLHHHHLSRLLSFSACFIIITTKVHSTKMIMCTLDLISFTISVVNHIVFSFQYFASVKKAQWKNIYSRVKKFNYVVYTMIIINSQLTVISGTDKTAYSTSEKRIETEIYRFIKILKY